MESVRGWHNVANRDFGEEEIGLRAAVSGDRGALQRLLHEHEGPLFALCRRMLGHAEDAEDAVQETFLRAIGHLHRFQGRAQLRSWLYRIAINTCLDQRRRRRPVTPLDEARLQADGSSVEAEALASLRLEQALQKLPARRRAIFLLKEGEGWTAGEIAETLRCHTSLVYYELREAFRALAQILGTEEGEEK